MSLNESIVEDAALEWFLLRPHPFAKASAGKQGYCGLAGNQPLSWLGSTGLSYAAGQGPGKVGDIRLRQGYDGQVGFEC